MNTIEKMKRLAVLNTQAENAQKNLEEINDLSLDDFLKYAEPSELDDLRAKVKARYEGYLREIMDEAEKLLGEKERQPIFTVTHVTRTGIDGNPYFIPIEFADEFYELTKKYFYLNKYPYSWNSDTIEELKKQFNELFGDYALRTVHRGIL